MASEKITALIEEVKALTVLELSELVHALEDEFGVSAAAPVAVAAATCSRCGTHYTDADGDGLCDNCPAAQTTTSSRGQGNAWHHTEHAGHGHQTGHHWGGHHGC